MKEPPGRPLAEIRAARAADAAELTRIAHAAKRRWGYAEDLIEAWRMDLTVGPELIASHPVYCAVEGASIVGFYALSRDGDAGELEHMWVDPPAMARGIGATLFRHAASVARAAGVTVLRIASDPNAEGFYRKMGARRAGEVPSRPPGRTLPLLVLDVTAGR
ncbi:MAG: GNAT family N-acetyltransferase [Candidatus Binatia bacterium]